MSRYTRAYSHFRAPMRQILEEVKGVLGEGDLWEDKDSEDWGWHLVVGEGDQGADLSLVLADAEEYEGEEERGKGDFLLTACEYGGAILISYAPHNYTPNVWVTLDPSGWPELQKRLDYIGTGIDGIADKLKPYCKGGRV